MHDWVGESISSIEPDTVLNGRYRVVQSLSYGGFGETFQVIDEVAPLVNNAYQVKVLKILNLSRFQEAKSRQKSIDLFRREARVLSRLHHPGIPKVDEGGYFTWPSHATNPLHCLVMEYVEGRSLDVWMRLRHNQPLKQDQAVEWLQQLVTILDVIHRQGLIHRDIKPSNIMLTASGQLVLIDFGAVRDVTVTYLQNTGLHTGTRIFAAGYTPHEQAEGRARAESDFFALGRTFVHLMSGMHPMGIDIDDKTGKLDWRSYVPQISDWLADLIDRMMETMPGNRPRTAQEILQQLQGTSSHGTSVHAHAVVSLKEKRDPWPVLAYKVLPDHWANVRAKSIIQGHRDQIRAIAIHPDSTMTVSAGFDGELKLWSLPHGKAVGVLNGHPQRLTSVAIDANGQAIASGGYDRCIRLWSLPDGEIAHTLPRQTDIIQALVFHPQKPILVSATGTKICQWSTQSGRLISQLPQTFNCIRSLDISPDGRLLAIGTLAGTVELWSAYSQTQVWQTSYQLNGTTSVRFSPNGQLLACATGATIELLDIKKRCLGVLHSHQARVLTTIAFNPDGQVIASASGRSVEIWSVAHAKRLSPPLVNHKKPVRSLAFTPNGRMLVSAGADHTLVLWQPVGS
ncbi:MAG: serine/threonine-protein kinase [Leptolyngbyaceae bacterium]|nr:serine/threonine-protein kinase [Leptolyngbyaceae bacterium]